MDEMSELHESYILPCQNTQGARFSINAKPGMMFITAVDHTHYISSSIKDSNPKAVIKNKDKNAVITRALAICRSQWLISQGRQTDEIQDPDKLHRTGSCGEIMSAGLMLKDTKNLPGIGARVVSYGGVVARPREDPPPQPTIVNPCYQPLDHKNTPHNPIGCEQFIGHLEVEPILKGTVPEQVDTPAPKEYVTMDLSGIWEISQPSDVDPI